MTGVADLFRLNLDATARPVRSSTFSSTLANTASASARTESGRRESRYSVRSPGDAGVQLPETRQDRELDSLA